MMLIVLGIYAAVALVGGVVWLTRSSRQKPPAQPQPMQISAPAPQPIAPAPAPARPAYHPDALLPPIRHTPARTRTVPAPQPQPQPSGEMTATDAFVLGLVLGSWDTGSQHHDSSGSCDDGSGWNC
jgi:hypothetical protein